MKRFVSFVLLCTFILSFGGCDRDEASVGCRYEYEGSDLSAFCEWAVNQEQMKWADSLTEETEPLILPVLHAEGFCFWRVEAWEDNYFYYYMPVGTPVGAKTDDSALVVYVSKGENSFDAVMKQHELTPVDGAAYYQKHNEWFVDYDGRCLSVTFPDTIVLADADQIDAYFTFAEYGAENEIQDVLE